jgi:hypothetical protein
MNIDAETPGFVAERSYPLWVLDPVRADSSRSSAGT